MRSTYLMSRDKRDGANYAYTIKNKRFNSRFGFDEMVKLGVIKPEKWAMVPFSIIKTHIKLISSLLMYKSVLLLSHQ